MGEKIQFINVDKSRMETLMQNEEFNKLETSFEHINEAHKKANQYKCMFVSITYGYYQSSMRMHLVDIS